MIAVLHSPSRGGLRTHGNNAVDSESRPASSADCSRTVPHPADPRSGGDHRLRNQYIADKENRPVRLDAPTLLRSVRRALRVRDGMEVPRRPRYRKVTSGAIPMIPAHG